MNNMINPLVTIGVYTYNSSETVLETLESVKRQTYPNIELIISDDCSKDDTVEKCNKWIDKNKQRFVNVRLLKTDINTGQSGNYNRVLKVCSGEWIKDIDGDDLLTPNCIEDYIEYVKLHPEAIFVFGKTEVFGKSKEKIDFFVHFFNYDFFKLPVQDKYNYLITKGNCIASPSAFSNVSERKKLGLYYDERIPMLEDLPMWVNATKRGIDLFFLDKVVCKYRVGGEGVTSGKGHVEFQKSQRLYEIYYVLPFHINNDYEKAIEGIASYEINLLNTIASLRKELNTYHSSFLSRIKRLIFKGINRLNHSSSNK